MGRPTYGPKKKPGRPLPVEKAAPVLEGTVYPELLPETDDEFWNKVIDLKDMKGHLLLRGTRMECKHFVMSRRL